MSEVHLLKEMKGDRVQVKCGLEFAKKRREEWTGWSRKITCKDCGADLREPPEYDILISPTTTGRDINKESEEMAREAKTITFSDEEKEEVLKLRDTEGLKWGEIATAMGIAAGKAILIYNFATLRPKDKIKDPTPADVRRLRDVENLSWGVLSARTAISESSLRSMYEEAAGHSAKGTRIGKGGRYPGGETPEKAPKPASTKKAAAKAPAAPKVKAEPGPLKGLSSAEIKEKITGFAIKHGDETIAVKEVKKASATTIVLVDSDGKARTVKTAAVKAVSKKKVL